MSISKLSLKTLDFSIFVKNVGPEKVVPNWSGSLYLYLNLLYTHNDTTFDFRLFDTESLTNELRFSRMEPETENMMTKRQEM